MPIYEYRCAKCGDFDAMQKITDKPLRKCPTCKGKVSKLISNTAFQLKGTGWYVTDYAGKGKSGSSSGESAKSSDDSGSAKSSSSSDSKDAKKDKPTAAPSPAGSNASS